MFCMGCNIAVPLVLAAKDRIGCRGTILTPSSLSTWSPAATPPRAASTTSLRSGGTATGKPIFCVHSLPNGIGQMCLTCEQAIPNHTKARGQRNALFNSVQNGCLDHARLCPCNARCLWLSCVAGPCGLSISGSDQSDIVHYEMMVYVTVLYLCVIIIQCST